MPVSSDATKTTYKIVFSDETSFTYDVFNGQNGVDGEDGEDGQDGSVVTIGQNGNWFIDGIDTGVKAEGSDGNDGTDGSVITIGNNGN